MTKSKLTVEQYNQPLNIPQMEEEVLAHWQTTRAFEQSVDQRPENKPYVFYDGPPFATGMPHYGHLLASTIKDVIPRYWTMKGYRVERVWGWDCHGLPIENMIEKELGLKGGKKGIEQLGIDKFNAACKREVLRLDKEWEKIIGRLGRWVDFKNSYKTMDNSYMESVWWAFKQLADKDLVYEGRRVILYCPRCATPLSNFEIAMDNSYKDLEGPSTVYKYKIKNQNNTYLLAWSTTPWNKLATPALAVNPDLTYVKVKQGNEFYILAEDTQGILKSEPKFEVVETYKGIELEQFEFELHYDFYPRKEGERAGVIVADNYVTAGDGTGIVTLAVYGEDDYRVMTARNVQLVEHVDSQGLLKPEVTPWAGMFMLKVNPLVNQDLASRNLIYSDENRMHSVPVCYRCETRLYHAPVPAWFINVQKFKNDLIAQNENINWYPKHLKHGRFGNGLETAPDWNISRSRYWGTPMPVWVSQDKKHSRIIGSLTELKAWAVEPQKVEQLTDLHREFLDDLEVYVDDSRQVVGRRIPEVFDCWVESGSMPYASVHYPFENKVEFEARHPAQFISEYIAQTRAWFYTLHVMSVGLFGKHTFENAVTTGTILAEDGSKMSKSKKNYPDPMNLINQYGVDSLRLYMMSSTVMKAENLNFSEKEVSDIRRKVFTIWWNVLAFYQMYADKTTPLEFPTDPQAVLNRWLVSRTESLTQEVTQLLDAYDVVASSRKLMEYVNELSTWYVRRSRDSIRQGDSESSQTLGAALYRLSLLFASFTPFFSDLVYHNLPLPNPKDSIHLEHWPVANTSMIDLELETSMQKAQAVVTEVHAERKNANLKLRQPLASITISGPAFGDADLHQVMLDETNVKSLKFDKDQPTLSVKLDTTLTPQLQAEGEAREIIRKIQQARKNQNIGLKDQIIVELPSWPASFETEIKQKVIAKELIKSDVLKVTVA